MNWWSILKQPVQQTFDFGFDPQKPVQEGAATNPNMLPTMHQSVPDPNNSQRLNRVKTQTNITEQQDQQMATGTEAATQQTGITQPQHMNLYGTQRHQPESTQIQPQQSTEAGGDDAVSDDTDVGSIRQNVDAAKRNLSQLPRGPKAAELTEILNLISQASIDPVKQKDIAVEAKKKLHSIFPSSMA